MTLPTYKWSIEEWHDLVNSGVLAEKRVDQITIFLNRLLLY